MEDLNRGVVAIQLPSGGVYVGWRLFGYDPEDVSFFVYRDGVRVGNALTTSTNLVDPSGTASSRYSVRAVIGGVERSCSEAVSVLPQAYRSIPLVAPTGTVTYTAGDASVGDLDGDGTYEIVLKWDPADLKDNASSGVTSKVYLAAYSLSGTRLWQIDLGRNVRAGPHYTQFLVYDLDGDGRAEVVTKTAPGTVDGTGQNVLLAGDNAATDYRTLEGFVLTGPEYLTVFDGATGAERVTVPFEVPRGVVDDWGDSSGNRSDRFRASVAFLDGTGRPSFVMARGVFTRVTVSAWNFRNNLLSKLWIADSNTNTAYVGQAGHSLAVANVDLDRDQEIILGPSTIDHNGMRKCSTGFGYGAALHVGDFLPSRLGLEVFTPHEELTSPAAALRDANTCAILFQMSNNAGGSGPTRAVIANLLPGNPAEAEAWVSGNQSLFAGSSAGVETAGLRSVGTAPSSANFLVYWDADPERELLNANIIRKYSGTELGLFTATGCGGINGTKATPNLSADLLGDFREEVILPCGSELRLFTPTSVASMRLPTLMHDPQYRMQVSSQNTGFNQPPHTSYFLGTGMVSPARPDIHVR